MSYSIEVENTIHDLFNKHNTRKVNELNEIFEKISECQNRHESLIAYNNEMIERAGCEALDNLKFNSKLVLTNINHNKNL